MTLRRPYLGESITKPLRSAPLDQVLDLSKLAVGTSYRGGCQIEFFDSDYGRNEAMAVVPPPYEGENFNVLTEAGSANLFKALVELSETACPPNELGDEALGLCYSPSPRAIALTKQFVESFGLLEWGETMACDCAGDRARYGRVSLTHEQERLIEQLDAVEKEMSEQPDVPDDELSSAIANLKVNEQPGPPMLGPLPWMPGDRNPFLVSPGMSEPESLAMRLAKLVRRQSSLNSELKAETEKAKTGEGKLLHQFIGERFRWLHRDFQHAHPEFEHANAVAWILQEALMLRRASCMWDALRRYRLGARSDVVASLWRKGGDGRLRLFDVTSAPLKPSHRILIILTQLTLESLVNDHVHAVSPKAALTVVPKGAAIAKLDLRRTNLTLRLAPRTPLAAAWLQLFDDILNDRASARICQECGEIFDPTRTDQAFCSTRCSNRHHQRAYRARVKSGSAKGRRTNDS